jgi:alkane 1-monooxygenase
MAHTLFLAYWIGIIFNFHWILFLYTFIFLPILDIFLTNEEHQPLKKEDIEVLEKDPQFKTTIYNWVFLYIISMIETMVIIHYNNYSLPKLLFMSFNFGLLSSLAIAVAHELSHKKEERDRILSKIILTCTLYNHFYIEHKYGHHINVATPLDPATAKKNQSVYSFIPQSIFGGIKNAWKLEYKHKGFINYISKSWFLNSFIISLLYLLNINFIIFYFVESIIGICLLEIVNYLEHYGLERKLLDNGKYEPVKIRHSWDSNNLITNCTLFRLGRHSDHHTHPYKQYQILIKNEDSPKLPFGYMIASLLTLCPYLWFKIMNPRLEKYLETCNKSN